MPISEVRDGRPVIILDRATRQTRLPDKLIYAYLEQFVNFNQQLYPKTVELRKCKEP